MVNPNPPFTTITDWLFWLSRDTTGVEADNYQTLVDNAYPSNPALAQPVPLQNYLSGKLSGNRVLVQVIIDSLNKGTVVGAQYLDDYIRANEEPNNIVVLFDGAINVYYRKPPPKPTSAKKSP
jgi:hypothetical protein